MRTSIRTRMRRAAPAERDARAHLQSQTIHSLTATHFSSRQSCLKTDISCEPYNDPLQEEQTCIGYQSEYAAWKKTPDPGIIRPAQRKKGHIRLGLCTDKNTGSDLRLGHLLLVGDLFGKSHEVRPLECRAAGELMEFHLENRKKSTFRYQTRLNLLHGE